MTTIMATVFPAAIKLSIVIPQNPHLAVGHVLYVVIVRAGLGHFNSARGLAVPEEGLAARVVDRDSVDHEPVVMKARDGRRRGDRPESVAGPLHLVRTLAQPVVGPAGLHLDALRLGCPQPKRHATVRSNARILSARHVGRRRLAIIGLRAAGGERHE
jgi:hypothetical protein